VRSSESETDEANATPLPPKYLEGNRRREEKEGTSPGNRRRSKKISIALKKGKEQSAESK